MWRKGRTNQLIVNTIARDYLVSNSKVCVKLVLYVSQSAAVKGIVQIEDQPIAFPKVVGPRLARTMT